MYLSQTDILFVKMGDNLSAGWIFPKDMLVNTPSRDDGVPIETEKSYRNKGCCLIDDLGQRTMTEGILKTMLNARVIISTACVLFHRFYTFQSFKLHDRYVMSVTCLFLACKIEENPIKLELLVDKYMKLMSNKSANIDKETKEFREKVIIAERILLHTLGFDLQLQHPYLPRLRIIKDLKNFIPEDRRAEVNQLALNFINDSFRTTLCLQYPADEIAVASILLALVGMELPCPSPSPASTPAPIVTIASSQPASASQSSLAWYLLLKEQSKVTESNLEDICDQIMGVLAFNKISSEKDAQLIKTIRRAVGSLFPARSQERRESSLAVPSTEDGGVRPHFQSTENGGGLGHAHTALVTPSSDERRTDRSAPPLESALGNGSRTGLGLIDDIIDGKYPLTSVQISFSPPLEPTQNPSHLSNTNNIISAAGTGSSVGTVASTVAAGHVNNETLSVSADSNMKASRRGRDEDGLVDGTMDGPNMSTKRQKLS